MKLLFLSGVHYSSVIGGRTVRLAQALAQSHELHFVEIPSLRRPRLRPHRIDSGGISVHSLPPCLGGMWHKRIAGYIKNKIGLDNAQIVVSNPFWWPVVACLPEAKTAYDCLDFVGIHHNPNGEEYERRLVQRADHVFIVSRQLEKYLEKQSVLLPNAAPKNWLDFPLTPGEKIIGFHGALYEWVDYQLLDDIAAAFPDWTLRLVGPVRSERQIAPLRTRSNVEFLPQCSFDRLPESIGRFQIGIVPFLEDEVAQCADPLKNYEYLALGKPFVSTVPIADSPFVKYAKKDAFINALHDMIARMPSPEDCRESVRNQTWEDRARQMEMVLRGGRH